MRIHPGVLVMMIDELTERPTDHDGWMDGSPPGRALLRPADPVAPLKLNPGRGRPRHDEPHPHLHPSCVVDPLPPTPVTAQAAAAAAFATFPRWSPGAGAPAGRPPRPADWVQTATPDSRLE
jgi:hypothetical protein